MKSIILILTGALSCLVSISLRSQAPTPPTIPGYELESLAKVPQAARLAQAVAPALPALPGPLPPNSAYKQRLQAIVNRGHGSPGRTLVIRTSDTDPKVQPNLEEDLAVMSRILDKALEQKLSDDRRPRAMGIDVFFAPGSSPIRSLYLEGYGALFLASVNFPLLPPPDKPEPSNEKSDTDSTWEETKRELYGQRDFNSGAWDQYQKAFKAATDIGSRQEYDEKKVEDLKDGLLQALRNASNIRNLKSDETITVCVFGGANPGPGKAKTAAKSAPDAPDEDGDAIVTLDRVWHRDGGVPARGTILTIRVKKSDADDFAKDKLSLEDFRQKASVTAYAGDSNGWSGGGGFEFFSH